MSERRVIVYGRRTFDQANGGGGQHPTGVPVIVVTHSVPTTGRARAPPYRLSPKGSRARWNKLGYRW